MASEPLPAQRESRSLPPPHRPRAHRESHTQSQRTGQQRARGMLTTTSLRKVSHPARALTARASHADRFPSSSPADTQQLGVLSSVHRLARLGESVLTRRVHSQRATSPSPSFRTRPSHPSSSARSGRSQTPTTAASSRQSDSASPAGSSAMRRRGTGAARQRSRAKTSESVSARILCAEFRLMHFVREREY